MTRRRPTRSRFGSIRKLPSGRWQARYTDDRGVTHSAPSTFETKDEAGKYLASVEVELSRGGWVDPSRGNITFADWSAEWLERDLAKRAKSKVGDAQILRAYLLPSFGTRPLSRVTPSNVQSLLQELSSRLAPWTVRGAYSTLRAIFSAAVDAELLARSPCRGVTLPPVEQKRRHVVTPDELARLASELPEEHRTLLYVAAVLGLRWSELAALRVRSLDLLRGTVSVTETLHEVAGKLVTEPPKSAASRRTLTMPAALTTMLAGHLASRGLSGADGDHLVFGTSSGPLRYANFRSRVWVPATKRAGLAGLTFHDLRRTAATALVQAGVDVRTAQERLGHADPRVTLQLYAQATNEADRAAALRLGSHFLPGDSSEVESSPPS